MKIASLVKAIIPSAQERVVRNRADLRVGDRLIGRVLDIKGNGRAYMDFGSFRASALVRFPMKKGEVVHVKVMDKGAPLRLSLCVPESGGAERGNKALLLKSFPNRGLVKECQCQIGDLLRMGDAGKGVKTAASELGHVLRWLLSYFEPVDMGKDVSEIAGRLKKLIEDGGIFYEKKLEKAFGLLTEEKKGSVSGEIRNSLEIKDLVHKDLKSSLLVLRGFLEAKDTALKGLGVKDPKGLRKTVEKFLAEIHERQNNSGAKFTRWESAQVYTFLLPIRELEEEAKIKVYCSKKGRGREQGDGFRISLLLNLVKLGQIRTDLYLKGKTLSVDFSVGQLPIKDHIENHLDDLKRAMADRFEHVSIKVLVSQERISEFDVEDLAFRPAGLLDLRV